MCTQSARRNSIFYTEYIGILSVRPSVRNAPVLDENGLTYRHSFFHHMVAQSF